MFVTKHFDVEFRKDGAPFDDAQVAALVGGIGDLTDLVVIAHGWNNDMAQARALYDGFFGSLQNVIDAGLAPELTARRFGAMRIFWPSKRFADEDLIPGGGASVATAANERALTRSLDRLAEDPVRLDDHTTDEILRRHVERAKALIPRLEQSADARREFVDVIRAVLNPDERHFDDGSAEFFELEAEELFRNFTGPVAVAGGAVSGGATSLSGAGGAANVFGDLLDGVKAAARRIANFATYYQMKSRAGTVGRVGVAPLLARARTARPALALHLVGHSFGARLVTAAAALLPPDSPGASMMLLQAAYSHNGLSSKFDGAHDGAFRTVVADRRVSGAVAITHTKNDRAVGVAYPLVSRISRDVASALGDENDPYGGMGRNGAQHTPEAVKGVLKDLGGVYAFQPGQVHNLRADAFISDHGDVTGPQVAYAFSRLVI